MKPGKRGRSRARPQINQKPAPQAAANPAPVPESSPAPTPGPEQARAENPDLQIIPVNLLAALEKMRGGGAVPVFITRELEKFLTEQGVYRDDMRPAEAWAKLNQIAGNEPEPEPPAAS
ncbi:MAG: hypothetical protein J0I20_07215 [Chloroflexi bacterium]|nr:hypothetical protein [Chloroflexota bacterium]OJV95215.1 MAG: hypothetical protein BGO39_24720 [Chloroflexi bacterium 54-19]